VFAGHYAPALALRRLGPAIPLWILFIAVEFVDILFSLFVLLGIEELAIVPGITASNPLDLVYLPYSHSVVATVFWSTLAGAAWYRHRAGAAGGAREAGLVALAVASHFLLDLIVHIPDLPIAAGDGAKLGLGLWNHRWPAMALEVGLLLAAALWGAAGVERRRRWHIATGVLVVVGVLGYLAPAPNSPDGIAILGLAGYLGFARLAWWVEQPT